MPCLLLFLVPGIFLNLWWKTHREYPNDATISSTIKCLPADLEEILTSLGQCYHFEMSPIQFGHPVVTCMYYFGTKIHLQYRADNKYVDRYVFVCIFDFSLSLSDSCLRNSANMYLMMCDMQETEMYFFTCYSFHIILYCIR